MSWERVSLRRKCPICQKPDWCLISRDRSSAICARVSEGAVKTVGDKGAGWLHRLRDDDWQPRQTRTLAVSRRDPSTADFSKMATRFEQAVQPDRLALLADSLDVTSEGLRRLRIGWDGKAWTFPMSDAVGHIVGIRRRFPDGQKVSVKGSRNGLFVPSHLPLDEFLLVCEGPTDTAAMLDLGFAAVGRPNCTGSVKITTQFARAREVVVMADNDPAGRSGALSLASKLALYCRAVRVIAPPEGIKDVRAWKQAGATREDVLNLIERSCRYNIQIMANRVPRRNRTGSKAWELQRQP